MKQKDYLRILLKDLGAIMLMFIAINIVSYGILWGWYCGAKGMPYDFFFYRKLKKTPAITVQTQQVLGMSKRDIFTLWQELEDNAYTFRPWTTIESRPRTGRFVNVEEAGNRSIARPLPQDGLKTITVYVLGGSTTFGYLVPDKDTIPAYLFDALTEKYPGRSFAVYNFGGDAYYSQGEYILLWRLIMEGNRPDIVVFLDGSNEYTDGQTVYTAEIGTMFDIYNDKDNVYATEIGEMIADIFPLTHLMFKIKSSLPFLAGGPDTGSSDNAATLTPEKKVERYLLTQRLIRSLGREFGFSAYFFLEPVPGYRNPFSTHAFLSEGSYRYHFTKIIDIIERLDRRTDGASFISLTDMLQDYRQQPFVDPAHYTPAVCERIARRIAEHIVIPAVEEKGDPLR